jgi:AcrR family transcriptional regulator
MGRLTADSTADRAARHGLPRARPAIGGRRARSAADKTRRREHLLAAARRLLQQRPFDAVTVATVAQAAGLAKASAYTYFATKEALFLATLAQELTDWVQDLDRRIGPRGATAAALARHLAASLGEAPTLRLLLARLHSTLEANVPGADLLWFKRFLAGLLARGGERIEQAVPRLRGRGEQVLLTTHALLIGFGQLAEPSPAVAAVLQAHPDLDAKFRIDLPSALRGVLETLLGAWAAAPAPVTSSKGKR